MSDTGTPDGTDLSEYDRTFVDVYLRTDNAAAAARAAGASPRTAARWLARPDIQAEISRRRAAVAAGDATVTDSAIRERLIADCDEAIRMSRESNNVAGLVAAIGMRAKLSGLAGVLQGDEPPVTRATALADIKDIARAVLELFRAVKLEPGGPSIGVARPGETLVRVSDPALAESIGAEPALSPAEFLDTPAAEPVERTAFEIGERELVGRGWVEYVELPGGGPNADRLRKWGVFNADGQLLAYRRSRADAIALAQSTPSLLATLAGGGGDA